MNLKQLYVYLNQFIITQCILRFNIILLKNYIIWTVLCITRPSANSQIFDLKKQFVNVLQRLRELASLFCIFLQREKTMIGFNSKLDLGTQSNDNTQQLHNTVQLFTQLHYNHSFSHAFSSYYVHTTHIIHKYINTTHIPFS